MIPGLKPDLRDEEVEADESREKGGDCLGKAQSEKALCVASTFKKITSLTF